MNAMAMGAGETGRQVTGHFLRGRNDTAHEIDAIVQKIFAMMTASECFPLDVRRHTPPNLHARVVFLRSCCKTCEISLSHEDADVLTRLMTGDACEAYREDVAGELCNMIAGGWKSRRVAEGQPIAMSPPEVGTHATGEFCEGCPTCFCGTYGFGSARFTVRLRCAATH